MIHTDLSTDRKGRDSLIPLLDAIPVAILLIDGTSKIQWVNRSGETLFRCGRESLIGQAIDPREKGRWSWGQEPNLAETLHACLRNGDSISRAECLWSIQVDGEAVRYDLRMSASAITISGNPLVLLALEDITPMKQLETRDRDAERLSLALQMARATTHELSQPLSVLVGNLDLLTNQGEVKEPLKDRIDRMSRSADRVVETVRRLQGIISPPGKGIRLKTGPVNSPKATLIA